MTNSNLSPNLPPDRVDGVLGEYFKAQVPKPFPAAPKTGVVRPANRPAAAGVDPMAHSRWALAACVVVLLIGERPGLATAESLSAYLAYCPRAGDTDARRNLISNIHSRGVTLPDATRRLIALISQLMTAGQSGVAIKESLPDAGALPVRAETQK